MKTNKIVKKVAKLSTGVALGLVIPVVSSSCNTNISRGDDEEKQKIDKSNLQKPVNGKVNYLAIGDDYTIGNNNSENAKNNNFFDKENKEVYGITYASYLANAILLLDDEKTTLNQYENYGLSYSTSEDWLYLLNPKKYLKSNTFDQTISLNNSLGFFNKDINSANLISKIKDSNLLTISLGFNDIFKKHEILATILNNYKNEEEAQNYLNNYLTLLRTRILEFKENYSRIIKEIRLLNKDININLIGLTAPTLQAINLNWENKNNVFKLITTELNKEIEQVAKDNDVNFYNFANQEEIYNNAEQFSTDFFSILPSNNAYKKLAQDVFAKMSMNKSDYNALFNNKIISTHSKAIDFDKKATTIKSLIFGVVGNGIDTYKKPYPFEKNNKNKELISSENKNIFTQKMLIELKNHFNSLDNNDLKPFIENVFNIFDIKDSKIKDWFFDLFDKTLENNKKELLFNLFNQLFESDFLQNLLNRANFKISELLAKKSFQNTTLSEIRQIVNNELREKENIYQILKSVLNTNYLELEENKGFVKENLTSLIKVIFSEELAKKIFPEKLSLIWEKASKNEAVLEKFNNLIETIVEKLLTNNVSYFENTKLDDFVNVLLKDSKNEIIDLFKVVIEWITNDEEFFEKTTNDLVTDLQNIYNIPQERIEDIKFFIQKAIINLKDFQYSYEFLDLFIETILKTPKDNENLKSFEIIKAFVNGLIFNTEDANKNNRVFFALISNNPNLTDSDLEKYKNGMKYLGVGLIEVENYLKPEKIGNLLDADFRISILNFFSNVSNNPDNILNNDGKNYIKKLLSLLIDDITKEKSLLNQILDKLGDYIAIYPLTNYIKKTKFEDQILASNPQVNNIEEFIKNGYQNLYKSINSKIVIDKLKLFVNDLIDYGSEYDKSSPLGFVISSLKRIKQNGTVDLLKTLLSQISSTNNAELFVDILATYLKSHLQIELSVEERNLLATYIQDLLVSVKDSDLFNYFINGFEDIAKRIDSNVITDFEKLGNFLKQELTTLLTNSTNAKNIQQLLDFISLKNVADEQGFNKFINVLAIFLRNEKIVNLILKKANLKELISSLRNKINLESSPEEIRDDVQQLINNAINLLTEKWDEKINPKIKELISNLVSNEKIKQVNNLNQLLSLLLKDNKDFIKEFTTDLIDNLLLNSDDNKNTLVEIAIYFISQKINYDKLSEEDKKAIKSIIKKGVDFTKDNQLSKNIVDGLLNTLVLNVENHGIDFNKYNWSNLLDSIKVSESVDVFDLINKFLTDKISKDELKTLIKVLLINTSEIIKLIDLNNSTNSKETNFEETEEGTSNQQNSNVEKVLNFVKNIINKLSAENKRELIPYVIDAIYDVKENEALKNFLINKLGLAFKQLDQNLISEIIGNQQPSNALARKIIEKSYQLLLNENNKQSFKLILESLFADEHQIELNLKNLLVKLLKNAEANNLSAFISNNISTLLADEEIIQLLSKTSIALLKKQLNITFDDNEERILLSYIKPLLQSMPNNELIIGLKDAIFNKLKQLEENATFNDLQAKFTETINEFFTFDKEKINKLFNLLIIKTNSEINGEAKLVDSLKILLKKQPIWDLVWNNFNLKTFISNTLTNINLENSGLGDSSKSALNEVIQKLKEFIEQNYDTLIKANIDLLIEKLLSDNVLDNVNSFETWFEKFVTVNKEWIIEKLDEIVNTFLSHEHGKNLREKIADFLVEIFAEKLNNLTFENTQKQDLKATFLKLINSVGGFNITKGIAKSTIETLIKNIQQYHFEFNEYDFNGLIDVIEIFNSINIEKILEFLNTLESKDLSTIILLIINNFEQIEALFEVSQPVESSEESAETTNNKNTKIIQFNEKEGIKIYIGDLFKLFKASLSILNEQDRQLIKGKIPLLVEKIRKSEKIKSFIGDKLQVLTSAILKEDNSATEFANKTKEKIVDILFVNEDTKDFLTSIINSLIDLDQSTLNDINTMNDLVKKLLSSNKETIKNFIKKLVQNASQDETYITNLFKFVLNILNNKLAFDTTGDEVQNISSLATRIVKNLSSKNIVTDLIEKLFEGIIDLEIFDQEGQFDTNALVQKTITALKTIDWKSLFTSNNVEDLFKAILWENLTKDQLFKEFNSLYQYLVRNIPKLNKNKENSSENEETPNPASVISEEQKAFLKNIESTIYNVLVGLNGSLEAGESTGKDAIVDIAHTIFKDQIKKINWKEIDQEIIPKNELQTIVDRFIEKPVLKDLIKDVATDFLTKPKVEAENIGEIVHKTLQKVSEKLKSNVTKVIEAIISDDELMKIVLSHIMNYLKLENTTEEDVVFLKELVVAIIKDLIKTEYYSRKIVKRTVDHVVNYSKNFTIFEPLKWLTDAINKIKSGFSFGDIKIVASFIGQNKAINGERLVKLINLLFGKSNLENSILYNNLRNLNMDPDHSKRTNMQTLLDFVKIGNISSGSSSAPSDDPDNISPDLDALKLMDEIFKILYQQYEKNNNTSNNSFKVRSKTPEWQAVYRFKVAMDFIIFEMFGRESLVSDRDVSRRKINLYSGVRSILWEIQEGTNISAIPFLSSKFSGMQSYFKNEVNRRQFTNYVKSESGWGLWKSWSYFEENDYGPESITYIIISSGYNQSEMNKLTKFKYKVRENGPEYEISKKDYILLTLKEGGYGKFMKINDRQSSANWSKLNQVNKDDFY